MNISHKSLPLDTLGETQVCFSSFVGEMLFGPFMGFSSIHTQP